MSEDIKQIIFGYLEEYGSKNKVYDSDLDGKITLSSIADDTILFETTVTIVHETQSVTSATLSLLTGRCRWVSANWTASLIKNIYVEMEWESAGAGDVDLYNQTDSAKIADIVTPSAATSRSTGRYDVTTELKAVSGDKVVGIQAAGDGTNALTIYNAKLVFRMGIS